MAVPIAPQRMDNTHPSFCSLDFTHRATADGRTLAVAFLFSGSCYQRRTQRAGQEPVRPNLGRNVRQWKPLSRFTNSIEPDATGTVVEEKWFIKKALT